MILYKHNRSGKIYKFVAQAQHTEDKTNLIVYEDFPKTEEEVVRVYARPSEMFFEYVTMESGEEKPRFEIIDNYSDIFTDEEREELRKIANGKPCKDIVKVRNADDFIKWL